jgi:imidazolonepropionase-like amidohydrolase
MVADLLARAKVPVILDPFTYGVGDFDSLHARRDNAALLEKAGVSVLISTFSAHNIRTLREAAGNAVREGMSHEAAMMAVTTLPAEVFGVADHGSIAAGQVANLVVWKGSADDLAVKHDPFDPSTAVEAVFIQGRVIPLLSRQTELRERYRTLPGTPGPLLLPTP